LLPPEPSSLAGWYGLDLVVRYQSIPERISFCGPGGSFSRAVVGRCPIRVRGVR
jgi:hypothetical protein